MSKSTKTKSLTKNAPVPSKDAGIAWIKFPEAALHNMGIAIPAKS